MTKQQQNRLYIRAFTKLVSKAIQGKSVTYKDFAEELNLPTEGHQLGIHLSPVLTHIANFCKKRGWPPLTVIVVRKSGTGAGLPGNGFWELMGQGSLNAADRAHWTESYGIQVFEFWALLDSIDDDLKTL